MSSSPSHGDSSPSPENSEKTDNSERVFIVPEALPNVRIVPDFSALGPLGAPPDQSPPSDPSAMNESALPPPSAEENTPADLQESSTHAPSASSDPPPLAEGQPEGKPAQTRFPDPIPPSEDSADGAARTDNFGRPLSDGDMQTQSGPATEGQSRFPPPIPPTPSEDEKEHGEKHDGFGRPIEEREPSAQGENAQWTEAEAGSEEHGEDAPLPATRFGRFQNTVSKRLRTVLDELTSDPEDSAGEGGLPAIVPEEEAEQVKPLVGKDQVIRFGIYVALMGLGGFFLWAAFVPLSEGVIASGQVAVETQRKTVQHLEGGIIARLNVQEGSTVHAGDVLIELDETQAKARFDLLQTRYFTTQALFNRLAAERDQLDTVFYDAELLAERAQNNETVEEIIEQQNNLFVARREQTEGQIAIQEQRIGQLQRQIEGLQSQLSAKRNERVLVEEDLRNFENLRRSNLVDMTTLLNKRKEITQIDGELGRFVADIARAEIAISEAQLELLQIRRTLRQDVSQEILAAQEQLFELREQLAATEDVLKRTLIRAPQSGTVLGLRIVTEGGVIPPAEPIMEIVPSADRLVVEAQIRVTDIDNVFPGQRVRARFVAFQQRTTPEVNGEISSVGADAQLDSVTNESFYLAKIDFPQTEMARLEGLDVIPGMPVELFVEGGERTALQYLVSPIADVARRALTEQ